MSNQKTTKTNKKEQQEELIQINKEFIENILKDIKEPTNIFKYHTTNDIPKYKDEVLIALMIEFKLIKEYKCHSAGCTVKKCWKRKPISLLLNRKNNKKFDLRKDNLELICPNCYLQTYGTQNLFEKLDSLVSKCIICKFPLNNGKNKNNNKYCYVCTKKMSQQAETEFENRHNKKLMEISSQNPYSSFNNNKFGYSTSNNYTDNRVDFSTNSNTLRNTFRNHNDISTNSNTNRVNNRSTSLNINMKLNLDLNDFVDTLDSD